MHTIHCTKKLALLEVISSLIKSTKKIVKESAAGFAVDVMAIAPLPVLFQIIFVLQDLEHSQVTHEQLNIVKPT